jgi:hypothetical protein
LKGNKKNTQVFEVHLGLCATLYWLPNSTKGYSDANWISDIKDSKSTSRYIFTFCGALVLWKSFKQTCIIRFTMKSEFITFDKAGDEAKWIQNFLDNI